jgi:hypothetical protein
MFRSHLQVDSQQLPTDPLRGLSVAISIKRQLNRLLESWLALQGDPPVGPGGVRCEEGVRKAVARENSCQDPAGGHPAS